MQGSILVKVPSRKDELNTRPLLHPTCSKKQATTSKTVPKIRVQNLAAEKARDSGSEVEVRLKDEFAGCLEDSNFLRGALPRNEADTPEFCVRPASSRYVGKVG
ncbi:hypothetical protein K0M31_008425 [Melipona bicolor]|uniref:Uncharacterized protein n=1 Tax=Melipona bicolor TaxID=60889 RepID=A0AA40KKF9_9HYME|nr:hypothetical protein K0M31_008425 [Melipona bicolor]